MRDASLPIERILEKLGVGRGVRPREADAQIKGKIYESLAKEVVGFLYKSLDRSNRKKFEAELKTVSNDPQKINLVINKFISLIPHFKSRLKKKIRSFEKSFYSHLLLSKD